MNRRSFIRGVGASAVVAALPSFTQAQTTSITPTEIEAFRAMLITEDDLTEAYPNGCTVHHLDDVDLVVAE